MAQHNLVRSRALLTNLPAKADTSKQKKIVDLALKNTLKLFIVFLRTLYYDNLRQKVTCLMLLNFEDV